MLKVWTFSGRWTVMNRCVKGFSNLREKGFRVSKWIRWLKEITKGQGNMKGFEAKMMVFCVRIAFGFPASLKHDNVGSYLSHPHFKTALTLHIYLFDQKLESTFWRKTSFWSWNLKTSSSTFLIYLFWTIILNTTFLTYSKDHSELNFTTFGMPSS